METLMYPGFRKIARQQWRHGLAEIRRSLRKSEFVASCRRLVPELRDEDMSPGGSGVRAQALGPDGNLVDDFRFVPRDRFLHVLNVPSPAATASLPIGREILKMVPAEFLKG
jgi:L-2-hydroxyglutarate oxidase